MSVLFGLIFFGTPTVTLLWWRWADRRVRGARSSNAARRWGWARTSLSAFGGVFYLGFVWLLVGRMWPDALLQWGFPRVPPPWLMGLLMLWAILVLPLMVVPTLGAWMIWRGGQGLLSLARLLRQGGSGRPAQNAAALPLSGSLAGGGQEWTRRQMLTATMATAPVWTTVGLVGVGLVQRQHFRIRELTVEVPSLPKALDGVTIAHVSDTHVGKFTQGAILDRIADATNDLAADLVLLTGDLLDHSVRDLPEAVRMLDRLDRRSGMFLIEGNHDLFDGREAFARGLRQAEMPLLLNEAATVLLRGCSVQILGALWHGWGGTVAAQVDQVAALRDPQAFSILLAHHPHAFDRAAELGIPLTLAGHTHGGQFMLTRDLGAGPTLFKYWSGLYEQGDSRLVVSNGAGNWFPVRINAPAEILYLTLRSATLG